MCGIVGYVGNQSMIDVVVRGLKRLEYRGYDSSGIAYFEGGKIQVRKAAGKITEMEKLVSGISHSGSQGTIGHTRWATHGAPNSINAHPHQVGPITLVHNGIIENYQNILSDVRLRGLAPQSETDSELFGFLVLFEMESGTPFVEAVRRSFLKVHGSCSIVIMHEDHPGLMIGIRNGSPLVAASKPEWGTMLASDAQALLDHTNEVYYLENGDMALCQAGEISFRDLATDAPIQRKPTVLDWSADRLDKNGYAHYMLKEIHEQSRTIRDTLTNDLIMGSEQPFEFSKEGTQKLEDLLHATRLSIVACGTSWHASLLGKYWMEQWTNLSVDTELASEFRYRNPVLRNGQLIMGISQSGETADTLAVIRDMKSRKLKTLAITNVRGSNISRDADTTFYTHAGPEIGVASTKAFTAQMLALFLLAGRLSRQVNHDETTKKAIARCAGELFELPHYLSAVLNEESSSTKAIKAAAKATSDSSGFFFIGRGYSYPLALEGALKLKEIAYVHAEGYAAGELKHGPIAMLEPSCTVIVLAPQDQWYEKTVSNLQEVKARGARIISIGQEGDTALASMSDFFIPLPAVKVSPQLNPFLMTPLLQLFSYEVALIKGTDVDQPRNLAKSVTVE